MITIDDIRQQVRQHLIAYLTNLPRIRQLPRLPKPAELDDQVQLRDLGFNFRDNQALGRRLAMCRVCEPLDLTETMPWKTVGDVIESVIRHPLPPKN